MKEIISDFMLLALGAILLAHLILIAVFNSVVIYENNEWVLGAELLLLVGIVALSVDRIIDDFRRK